jgi:hypothetical protein
VPQADKRAYIHTQTSIPRRGDWKYKIRKEREEGREGVTTVRGVLSQEEFSQELFAGS